MAYIPPSNGNIQKIIINAIMANNLQSVPSSARYLATLIEEKRRVFQRLQEILAKANIHLDSSDFEGGILTACQIFQTIQQHNPGLAADVYVHNHNLYAAVPLVEQALNMTICRHYSLVITQQLLHIEFLDNQIKWVAEEIEREMARTQNAKKAPALTWEDAFKLAETLPDRDQPTLDILAEAGFDSLSWIRYKRTL